MTDLTVDHETATEQDIRDNYPRCRFSERKQKQWPHEHHVQVYHPSDSMQD